MTGRVPVRRVDHVAIALADVAVAVPLFVQALGGQFVSGGDNEVTGIRLVHLVFPGLKLELLQPLRDDTLLAESCAGAAPGCTT